MVSLLKQTGGVWIDDDAVPLIDMYNIFAGVGLQTISAWSNDNHYNNHVLFLHKKSRLTSSYFPYAPLCVLVISTNNLSFFIHTRLAVRRLKHLVTLPFDKPYLWPIAVQRNCKFGYVFSRLVML